MFSRRHTSRLTAGMGASVGAAVMAMALAGCAATDPDSGQDPAAISADDAVISPVPVLSGKPSPSPTPIDPSLAVAKKDKAALKKRKASRKDPFALSRNMRVIRQEKALAAEIAAAEAEAAAAEAAEKAKKQEKARLKAAKKTKKQAKLEKGGLVVGDSVALGAQSCLNRRGYEVDAVNSRSFNAGWAALKKIPKSTLPHNVIIHLGTNGPFTAEDFEAVMTHLGDDHDVVWVTVALPDRDVYSFESSLNFMIRDLASDYQNATVADWNEASDGKSYWFYDDEIHINGGGCEGFAELVDSAARK